MPWGIIWTKLRAIFHQVPWGRLGQDKELIFIELYPAAQLGQNEESFSTGDALGRSSDKI